MALEHQRQCAFEYARPVGKPEDVCVSVSAEIAQIFVSFSVHRTHASTLAMLKCQTEETVTKHQLKEDIIVKDLVSMDWNKIMPSSFNAKDAEKAAHKLAGEKIRVKWQAFVKTNEILNKIKPRLIQHAGQEGSAHESVVNTIVTALIYGSEDMLERSIKKTSLEGVAQRVDFAINEDHGKYANGLLASNDYGAFDSSMTDRGHKPGSKGLRGTVEGILFEAIHKLIGDYTTHSEKSSNVDS